MSTQDAKLVAQKYVQLVNKKFDVQKAWMFGSFAKGIAHEGSDIDVCIISSDFGRDYFAEEDELLRLSIKIDPRLSPVAFSPQDIQNKWSQLAHEITTYGILL